MPAPTSLANLARRVTIGAVVGVAAAFLGCLALLLHTFRRYGHLLPED
jgi:hypothetical protein